MGISTVPSALRCIADDLILRASHVEAMDARLQAADALAKAADPLVASFIRMRDDHHGKLVHHQTLETASENWDKLLQEPLEFGPLIQALETYKSQSAI